MSDISKLVKEANKDVFDLGAGEYDAHNPAHYNEITRSRVREILTLVNNDTIGQRLLDAGCGTGNILKAAKGLFREAAGFDISMGMCREAKKGGGRVVCADFDFVPFAGETFDCVAAFSVIHHLTSQETLLKEVFRVLRPGGYFYGDYDPSYFNRATRRGKAYNKFYRFLLRLRGGAGDFETEERDNSERAEAPGPGELAEYGRIVQNGLNPVELKQSLLRTGFRKVRIFYHDDFSSLSIWREKRWKLRALLKAVSLLLLKGRCDFLPYFVTLAKK